MDRDYIWEGEYGRRSHLIPVFQQLLREQDASSLQMLSLFVNNNPYNLEFFIAVSYDRPKEEHLDRMFRLLEDAGLRQRKDLTALNIMRAMADRRFNSASLLDEDSVPTIMGHLFFFPEIRVLEEKGYRMTPFGREQMVFLSHSSLDKPEIEEIIPLLKWDGSARLVRQIQHCPWRFHHRQGPGGHPAVQHRALLDHRALSGFPLV